MFMSLGDRNRQTLLQDEYARPVESIMKCEDFKSNFARRLSNRYVSKTPVGARSESTLKLRPLESYKIKTREADQSVATAAIGSDSKKLFANMEQIRETAPDRGENAPPGKHADMTCTELTALNMEIETLRWQLAQTEANRQMHIALLNQIISFLNRIKEHMESQKKEKSDKQTSFNRFLSEPTHLMDTPKSRSVFHLNKNTNLGKSAYNVSSEYQTTETWGQSQLSLLQDFDTTQKITEEIARLITLANTVMSTKIPDLACGCADNTNVPEKQAITPDTQECGVDDAKNMNAKLEVVEENATCASVHNTYGNPDKYDSALNKFLDVEDKSLDLIILQPPLSREATNNFELFNDNNKGPRENTSERTMKEKPAYKRGENNVASLENESGFSSMSSFQEIGIPIINIIPPTPDKELSEEEEQKDNGEVDISELEKQTLKVFWV